MVTYLSNVGAPTCSFRERTAAIRHNPDSVPAFSLNCELSTVDCELLFSPNSSHSGTIGNRCPTSRTRSHSYHYIKYPCRRADIFGAGTAIQERTSPTGSEQAPSGPYTSFEPSFSVKSDHSRTIGNCCPTSRTHYNIYHYLKYPCRCADNFVSRTDHCTSAIPGLSRNAFFQPCTANCRL